MPIHLTDAQLVALSAAAKREDRCIAIPASLKTARKRAAKLVAAGLAKEIKAKSDAAVWRRHEETGQAYALKITAAGLKAISVETEAAPEGERDKRVAIHGRHGRHTRRRCPGPRSLHVSGWPSATRRFKARDGRDPAPSRRRRNDHRVGQRHTVAAAYNPRGSDRIAQARLWDRAAEGQGRPRERVHHR
jgi:hypothetical protein